ncbi:MAG: FecCD family ABC transporter permease [Oligosphaeraceae bacterium]
MAERESNSCRTLALAVLMLGGVVVTLLSPFVGVAQWSPEVLWRLRLPRLVAGLVAGGGLSLCGMCYQGVFRNELATPYTLGVSGGAALGVALLVRLLPTGGTLLGVGLLPVAAFAGAVGATALVMGLGRLGRGGLLSSSGLLLAGVASSYFFSSLIMFLNYLGTPGEMHQVMRWLMGGLDVYDWREVSLLAGLSLAGALLIMGRLEALDLLAIGEDYAASRGVSVRRTMLWLHLAVALIVGGVVAVCGPIGFVGMVSPHICRLLVGASHRRLAWCSLSFGACFLVLCDTVGRLVTAPAELPVGIVTALLGAPFFVWLLLRRP